jgi:tetratricopeptide (TPR) repeat protein
MATGEESKAFLLVEPHIKMYEKDFKELMEMADHFMRYDRFKIGILYFSAAKKLEPQNPALPIWLMQWKYSKEAYTLMKEQLEENPRKAELVSNAIMITMGRDEKDAAKKYIDLLREISPSNLEVLRDLGFLAYQENNFNEAIFNWKEVLKNDPKDIAIIRNLNKVYKQKQMWNESYNLLYQALEDNPNDPQLLDEFSKLLVTCPDERYRDISEGREFAERAFYSFYSSFETQLSAAKNLATAYAMLGDKNMAIKFMKISLDMAKNVNTQEYITYFEGLKKQYGLN